MERTFEKIRQSAIVIYVFDVSEMTSEDLEKDLARLENASIPLLVVGNKVDKISSSDRMTQSHPITYISSKNQVNIDELKKQLLEKTFSKNINLESTIVTNARHFEALQNALTALDEVNNGMEMQISGELLALDIKRSLQFLGEITGEITTDDLLGNIFGKFCIGK